MFHFSVAVPALKQGLLPNSFGSDLHRFSMNSGMKNMLDIMSKFLNLGMSVHDIIYRATWNSAQSIKKPELGNLSVGSEADLAILDVRKGSFGFVDAGGSKLTGDKKFEAEMTIRAGKVVWDLNGLAAKEWNAR
jgi:dihydroorotase